MKNKKTNRLISLLKRLLIWLKNIFLLLFALSLFFVLLYKYVPVYYTPPMLAKVIEQLKNGEEAHIAHKWVPLTEISQNLVQAVIASEDNMFLIHNGFSFIQIEVGRIEYPIEKPLREANTLSQQTAQNVFSGLGNSWLRKGLETYYTFLIEFVWGKQRIMEVYLNSVEMRDGVFGADAASGMCFQKQASELTAPEAALIAVALSNPKEFDPAKPTAYMLKQQAKIIALMSKIIPVEMGKSIEIKEDE
jgi:monofunctional biosynthetic peptidoglycan transglycosylase